MSSISKKLLGLAFVIALLLASDYWLDSSSRADRKEVADSERMREFCETIRVGSPIEDVKALAASHGYRVSMDSNSGPGLLIDQRAFSVCQINGDGERIVSKGCFLDLRKELDVSELSP